MEKFSKIELIDVKSLIDSLTRDVKDVVIHCSATREGQNVSAETIEKWHLKRGFDEIGYNIVIDLDCNIIMCRDWNKIPAHVKGNNSKTLGICLIGGLDKNGKPKDTFNKTHQKLVLYEVLSTIMINHFNRTAKKIGVKGHRDYSPDLDGDGIIESFEWTKSCPCFDVQEWFINYRY